jgi:hypothetical protein
MTDIEKATALIQAAHIRGGGCYLTPEMVAALVAALVNEHKPLEYQLVIADTAHWLNDQGGRGWRFVAFNYRGDALMERPLDKPPKSG